MGISIIRKFTDEDDERIEAAAKRFCEKRGIKPEIECDRWGEETPNYTLAVKYYLHATRYYVSYADIRAWRQAFARALRERESKDLTTGYGYVGHYAD